MLCGIEEQQGGNDRFSHVLFHSATFHKNSFTRNIGLDFVSIQRVFYLKYLIVKDFECIPMHN